MSLVHRRSARRLLLGVGAALTVTIALAPGATAAVPEPTPSPSAPVALPAGQSDQPAPASRTKRVIENVHTDTVSSFVDDGRLVLESKADVDVDDDGAPDLGSRLDPDALLFHLGERGNGVDSGRIAVPDLPGYAFLGAPGSTIWMAPQTQDSRLIWPGFSTEDPSMTGRVGESRVSVRLTDVVGPGDLEMYLQSARGPVRAFSSDDDLAPWTLTVPQHQHLNWAFDAAGTYTLTFEMTATVDGRVQTAENDYVFVVGDLAAHTRDTVTSLHTSAVTTDPGRPVLLTARVSPDAEGAVQFRDLTSGSILGHTPVSAGTAEFRADALTPGAHRIVAEFVPAWSNDARPSASAAVAIVVSGEALPRPTEDDTAPVTDADLAAQDPGTAVRVSSPGRTIDAGGTLTAVLTDAEFAGDWISVWVPGDEPEWRGWVQADLRGGFSVSTSDALPVGQHRLIVKSREGELLGWDVFSVTAPSNGGATPGAPPAPSAPAPEAPAPPAQAAPQQCRPPLTLETGHIDAFYVSAADGRAVLQLMEDVTGHRVIREPENVLLRVRPSAYRADIPAGTPGAPSGYVLPLTQDPALIWPGWDTNRTAASGYSDVSITVAGVDGPGRVFLSTQGSFGGISSLLTSGGYSLPGTIREQVPAHTHAQWVFSQDGVYRLTAYAVATNPTTGESLRTAARTYLFQVGDVPLDDAFCGVAPVGVADSAAVNAAVNRAAADAVAAAQADAAAQAAAEEEAERSRAELEARTRVESDASGDTVEQASTESPAVVAGIVGGGLLVVAGIVGLTVWYVRRVSAPTPPSAGSGA